MIKSVILFLSIGCLSQTLAQETGIIRFGVETDNGVFEILVNDTLLIKSYRDTLPVGDYKAVVWSPSYETKEISFSVGPGENGILHVKLVRSEEYLQNIKNSIEYDKKRRLFKHTPVFLTTTGLITAGIIWPFLRRTRDTLNDLTVLYNVQSTPWNIRDYKENFVLYEQKYNRQRAFFYGSIGFSCATFAAAIFTFRYFNKHFHYSKLNDESPWRDRFSFSLGWQSIELNLRI